VQVFTILYDPLQADIKQIGEITVEKPANKPVQQPVQQSVQPTQQKPV
jgi:hypothetical protein